MTSRAQISANFHLHWIQAYRVRARDSFGAVVGKQTTQTAGAAAWLAGPWPCASHSALEKCQRPAESQEVGGMQPTIETAASLSLALTTGCMATDLQLSHRDSFCGYLFCWKSYLLRWQASGFLGFLCMQTELMSIHVCAGRIVECIYLFASGPALEIRRSRPWMSDLYFLVPRRWRWATFVKSSILMVPNSTYLQA